jgi:biopolymer transport protein TolR
MAASAATTNPSGRRRGAGRRGARRKPMSDINVTPFVDVMLVLLIVFMVTAPLLSAGVPVDLPQAAASPLPIDREPVTVTIATDGKVFVRDQAVALADLVPRLKAVTSAADDRIYVRGDKAASYGAIMQVMGTISGAGFSRLALVALSDPGG